MRRFIVLTIGLAGALALALRSVPPARADVTIHCLDVGQGDATLIQSSSGLTLLFDAGDNGKGNAIVNPYLTNLGILQLTYAVASHYHADHIGGLDEVIYGTGVDVACYDRGWSYTTQTYQSYASASGAMRRTLADGEEIDLGDGVRVRCVAVNGNGVIAAPFSQPPYDENDLCIGLLVSCGDFDFYVGGDLGGQNAGGYKDIESSLAAEVGPLEVYRVDHHGSSYSTNATLVSAFAPTVAVVSVGTNSYGHPSQTVLNRLAAADSYIYQTERGSGGTLPAGSGEIVNGHVVIQTTGYFSYTVAGDVYPLAGPAEGPGDPSASPGIALAAGPNPFHGVTTIRYHARDAARPARLRIFDADGRLVRGWDVRGAGELRWDGRDAQGREMAAGLYFVALDGRADANVARIVLAR